MELNYDNHLPLNSHGTNAQIFMNIRKHGQNVADIAMMIGNELKMNDVDLEILNQSALLHDYGKYYIPTKILLKPSKLTFEEMHIMKKHVYYGSKIAISKCHSEDISRNILYHHENYDGTGYYGVRGEYIPLYSRIIKIADVYEALTSERPYRKALSKEKALEIMDSENNNFDKIIYELFIKKTVVNL